MHGNDYSITLALGATWCQVHRLAAEKADISASDSRKRLLHGYSGRERGNPHATSKNEIETAKQPIVEQLAGVGSLDILVNAAGLTDRGGIEDTTVATFDRLFAANTRAPFFVLQACLPYMRPRGAVAVNICSMLAYGGPPFLLAYSASNAALVALTKAELVALTNGRQMR